MRLAWISALLAANSAIALAEINWSPDLRSAHEQAKAQGKLLLVHFECDNCQYCEQLEAGAFQRPEVSSAIAQSYIPVKVNASRNRKLAEYFGVRAFPTDVIVDTTGVVHSHRTSPQAPQQYVAMLGESAAKGGVASANSTFASNAPVPSPPTAGYQPGVGQPSNIGQPSTIGQPTGPSNVGLQQPTAIPNNLATRGVHSPQNAASPTAQPNGNFQMPSFDSRAPAGSTTVSGGNGFAMPAVPNIQANQGPPANVNSNEFSLPSSVPSIDATSETNSNISETNDQPAVAAALTPDTATAGEAEVAQTQEHPPLAIDGFCVVSILEEKKWVEGDKNFGAIHLGKLYLFSNPAAQSKFLDDPARYTPALGGLDVVQFIDQRIQNEGMREFGLDHQGKLYFFSSEETLKAFFHSADTYSLRAKEIMRQAMESNPNKDLK